MKKLISMLGLGVCALMFTACATESATSDDSTQDQTAVSPQEHSTASEVDVPDALQPVITPRATCRSLHGVCTSPHICIPQNGVHPINGTGCPAGEVCCS